MLKLIALVLLVFAVIGTACAGPALDDVLNYMYRDQTTPTHPRYQWFDLENWRHLTKDEPIGQTFITGPETAKIVRIRCKIEPDADWQKGEGVEMVLWDSPAKKTALGRYTIWYEFRGYQFSQPEFEVKAEVKPNTQYYFELSYVGKGDSKISRVGLMNGRDSYKEGQGYLAGKEADFDVCFQTHVTKPLDRIGNLKRAFARFNLDMPQLAEVKQAVDKEDFDTAQAKLVAYFETRQEPVPTLSEVKPFPGFNMKEAEQALQNYFSSKPGKGYAGPDINWRAEPDFNPDGTIAASGWNTMMNRFGPQGPITKGYLATGDDKYAKKLSDLLLDQFIDNPPPGISQVGGDGSDPVWATLDAGARLANGFAAYSRVAKSPAFSLDCRMAYYLNLADLADTLVLNGAHDGGNWSFTQNSAMFEFGLNFPEYKNSLKWQETAGERIAIAVKRDILPDGVENESAPGYQRMSYGPLASIYKLIRDRGAKIPFGDELKGVIEKQAEYFMYLAMPNGITPFLGDWGNSQEREALKGDAAMLNRPDMLYVATAGKEGKRPKELSKLYPYFGAITMRSDWGDAGQPYEEARYLFMHGVTHGSHGHQELNEITLYAYGRELLVDPGSYIYGSPEHDLLCKSVSHNLLTIDGQEQNWRCRAGLKNWSTTPVADYVSSWVAAYKAGNYNRETFYIRANGDPGAKDYWIVRDTAQGTGTHSLEQRWHFYPGEAKLDSATLTAQSLYDDANLSIMQIDPSRLKAEQTTSATWVPRGNSGDAQKMPTFIYTTSADLPAAIDTALFPYKGKKMPKVQLKVLEKSPNGLRSAFKMIQGSVQDLFILQKSAGRKWLASEKVGFIGEKVFIRKVNGKLRSALLVNGSSLTVDGKQIIKSADPLSWAAVSFDASGVKAYASSKEPSLTVSGTKKITVTDTDKQIIRVKKKER